MNPQEFYTQIQPLIQREIQNALADKDNRSSDKGLFKINSVYHSHNGVDGPRVHAKDLDWSGLTLPITGKSLNISAGGNIQQALDTLNGYGGGTLYLQAGTYTQKVSLTCYSSVKLVGISPSQTVIDFAGTSAGLNFSESNIYNTGTITVASGVNITGSGTLWLTNIVPGQALFLGTRWYTIASITDDTHLVLAEAYGDNVALPSTYRISYPIKDFAISSLGLKNSTSGIAVNVSGGRQFFISDVVVTNCNKSLHATNVSEMAIDELAAVAGTGTGIDLLNVGLSNLVDVNMSGNSSHGCKIYNGKSLYITPGSSTSNGNCGYNIEYGVDISMLVNASGNGDKGIKLVSNCSNITLSGSMKGNTSDGINLTASTIGCKLTVCDIQGNGGYGLNIVAASDVGTLISTNYFNGNTVGQVNNAGTGSIARGNYNVADFG